LLKQIINLIFIELKKFRYYHLFKKGELDDLVNQIEIGKVVETGYDRDNWYVIAERI